MLPRLGVGLLCAASAIALRHEMVQTKASCHEAQPIAFGASGAPGATATATASAVDTFNTWLTHQGADISAVDFRPSAMASLLSAVYTCLLSCSLKSLCQVQDAGRLGVFAGAGVRQRAQQSLLTRAASWAGIHRSDITIASFPLSGTLTAANLAQHPRQGPLLRQLMEQGAADARAVVLLHLTVEKQRQRQQTGSVQDGLAPWVALLPSSFCTTLFYSELDLQWLRGTTLLTATRRVPLVPHMPTAVLGRPASGTSTLVGRCLCHLPAPTAGLAGFGKRACGSRGRSLSPLPGAWQRWRAFQAPPAWTTGSGLIRCFGRVRLPSQPQRRTAPGEWSCRRALCQVS
jgi:hypothetical protein